MELDILKSLLEPKEREDLYLKILNELEDLDKYEGISYQKFEISEGIIPIITIGKNSDINTDIHTNMYN